MKKQSLILLLTLLACSCAAPGQVGVNTPQQPASEYPPVVEDSPARRQSAEEAWKKFLSDRKLPEASPDLTPVTNTPRSLPNELAGRININSKQVKLDETELKQALSRFIEQSGELLSGQDKNAALGMKDLSLAAFSNDGNFYRAVFQQVNHQFPIAEGYGELRFSISKSGELLQLSSTLLPNVSLPQRAEIKAQSLSEKLLGREFTYTTIAGRPQSYRVSKAEEIKSSALVVYPQIAGSRLEIHLAYAVTVGNGMTWTVYIDAINGNELGVKQNFAS